MWTRLRVQNSRRAYFSEFLPPGNTPVSHMKVEEKSPPASGWVGERSSHCENGKASVLLTRPVLRRNYSSRARPTWGKEMPTPVPLPFLSHIMGTRTHVRISAQGTGTQISRPNHCTIKCFSHTPTPQHHITNGLCTELPFTQHMSAIKKKLQGIPKDKKQFEETEQASEPDKQGCWNYQTRIENICD